MLTKRYQESERIEHTAGRHLNRQCLSFLFLFYWYAYVYVCPLRQQLAESEDLVCRGDRGMGSGIGHGGCGVE